MHPNATKRFVSTFGVIMALAGLEHGIGEILQGDIAPGGLIFPSWPDSAFFQSLNGEPAMSIIPNMLVTGVLAIVLSLALLIWATRFIDRRHGGLVMMLIAAAMLLFGGGIFPPALAFIIGAVGTRIRVSPTSRQVERPRTYFARLWPWAFGASAVAFLLLFPGVAVMSYFFGMQNDNLTMALLFFALGSLGLTIWTGFAYDHQGSPASTIPSAARA